MNGHRQSGPTGPFRAIKRHRKLGRQLRRPYFVLMEYRVRSHAGYPVHNINGRDDDVHHDKDEYTSHHGFCFRFYMSGTLVGSYSERGHSQNQKEPLTIKRDGKGPVAV